MIKMAVIAVKVLHRMVITIKLSYLTVLTMVMLLVGMQYFPTQHIMNMGVT